MYRTNEEEKRFREVCATVSHPVFCALLRPTEAQVEKMKQAVGWTEADWEASELPAPRLVLREFLRARGTAQGAQERASRPAGPWTTTPLRHA